VRVNVLALALTHVFGESLEAVLRRGIMDPIGASSAWQWTGYNGAEIDIGGLPTIEVEVVARLIAKGWVRDAWLTVVPSLDVFLANRIIARAEVQKLGKTGLAGSRCRGDLGVLAVE